MIVNTEGPSNANIFIVGEAPGVDEDITGRPFIGASGRLLDTLLSQAGIYRHECLVGNVAREMPRNNKIGVYYLDSKKTIPNESMKRWIGELEMEIRKAKPNIVIALGNTALHAICGEHGIDKLRGTVMESTLVPGVKVLPTNHPARILRDWSAFFPTIMDLRKARIQSAFKEIPKDKRNLVINPSKDEWITYCEFLLNDPSVDKISLDIETLQPGSHISWFGMAHSFKDAMSLQLIKGRTPQFTENEEIEIWNAISNLMESGKKFIMHNASYDASVIFLNHGIITKNIWMDTMIAGHTCWTEMPKNLGFMASICLTVPAWKHLSGQDMGTYNALDAANTFGIAQFMEKEIERLGVYEAYKRTMNQLDPIMMLGLQGILVDEEARKKASLDTQESIGEAKEALKIFTKQDINYNSPKQIQKLLYVDMEFPIQYKRRASVHDKRAITTDEGAMKKLSSITNSPLPKMITKYKKATKLLTFLKFKTDEKGRVYTSYNPTGTDTYRWSSSENIILPFGPKNLQNIPQKIRNIFTPDKGKVIVQADYVQAEAVVMAYLSNDHIQKKLFKDGFGKTDAERKEKYDIHRLTASLMYRIPTKDISSEQRFIGKKLRHSLNYSGGPQVVIKELECSLYEAKKLIELFKRANPLLESYYSGIKQELRQTRTLTNLLGRKRRFFGRGDDLYRSAYAYKPQSTIGEMLNLSLVNLYNKHGEFVDILLQLHDAIYVQCLKKDVPIVVGYLKEEMIWPIKVNHEEMLIDIDFKVGKNWGEMELYE
ncbi:MAG TPA: hypothetical protein ENI76_09030 [Ignavibacteria bacterium]|nr:hypothetical protein [Ignavibacteria bacterium]